MRYLFFLTCFYLITMAMYGQHRIEYTYDAKGNRIKRGIALMVSKSKVKQQDLNLAKRTFSDKFNDFFIKLSSEPAGLVRINIRGRKETDRCSFQIFTLQGIQILTQAFNVDNVDLNLSDKPLGTYILRISINEKSATWKINLNR